MTVLAVLTVSVVLESTLLSLVLQNIGQRGNRDGFGACGGFGRDGYPPLTQPPFSDILIVALKRCHS